jgi:hypothetical protein
MGDFERPKASVWNDLVLPATGSLAARVRGEPVSRYAYTDDEEELRARAWRFVMPARERPRFDAALANLLRNRVLPLSLRQASRTAYYHALMRSAFRSPASRYQRIAQDSLADLGLVGPFVALATRVMAADEVRLRGIAYVPDLARSEIDDALARIGENRCLIAWVRLETYARVQSYRFSLQRLVVEAPQSEAVPAGQALADLETHVLMLDTLSPPVPEALCGGAGLELEAHAYVAPPHAGAATAEEPLVVKD